jgi:Zn-dependent protease/predicted transcriptional regulator
VKASWRIGRIAGVEVGVHWSVLFIVVVLTSSLGAAVLPDGAPGYADWQYWLMALLTALAFAASILAHEISHAVVANRAGVPVESIVLWLFGGVAKLRSNARTARTELRIALAGPAMSLLIGAASIGVAVALHATGRFGLVTTAAGWLGGINIVLALFNLMPGAPLDGGRVLTAILWSRTGDEQAARRRSANAGRILGEVLIGLGIVQFALLGGAGLWTALVGWLIVSMARMEIAQSEMHDVFSGVRVADAMTTDLAVVPDGVTVAEFLSGPWMHSRVSSFPIVDSAGQPVGLVTLDRIGGLAPSLWIATPLLAVAVPIDELVVAHPDEMLIDVLEAKQEPNGRVLVTSDDHLVGIISPSDVARAFERLSLARSRAKPSPGPRRPLPPPPPPPGQRGLRLRS